MVKRFMTYTKEHGYHPRILRFRNVQASFAVVVDQPNRDDFAFLSCKLDVSDEAPIAPYILEAHRLRDA